MSIQSDIEMLSIEAGALKLKLKLTTIWVGTENKWIFSI